MTAILPRIAWGGMAGTVIIAGIFMLQFQLQSEAHKAWVVEDADSILQGKWNGATSASGYAW